MKFKKALSLLAAAAVLTGTVSGCSGKTQETSESSAETSVTAEETVEETVAETAAATAAETSSEAVPSGTFEITELTEEAAAAAVERYISLSAEGDMQSAMDMTSLDHANMYAEIASLYGDVDSVYDIFSVYYQNLDYETSVTPTDEGMEVTVTGTAPDCEACFTAATNNYDLMVPIYADFLESTINGSPDMEGALNGLFGMLSEQLSETDTVPVTGTFLVHYDENGVVRVDPMDSMGLDFEFPESLNGSDLMEPAAEYLIEQGRITSEQYEMWQQLRNNLPAG